MATTAMLRRVLIAATLLLSLICTAAADTPAPDAASRPYLVNPGDIMTVSVWKEEDLIRQVVVRPDGAFSFPLTGDVQAAGRSVPQITAAVSAGLAKYIPEPVVTVSVDQLQGNKVYVIGQVNRPGELPALGRLDVVQALAIAGGMTAFANLDAIRILRRAADGVQTAIRFDYRDIEKGKRLHQNIILQPGDIVVVP